MSAADKVSLLAERFKTGRLGAPPPPEEAPNHLTKAEVIPDVTQAAPPAAEPVASVPAPAPKLKAVATPRTVVRAKRKPGQGRKATTEMAEGEMAQMNLSVRAGFRQEVRMAAARDNITVSALMEAAFELYERKHGSRS